MWSFLNQPGLAITSIDFTDELSFLLVALIGIAWLSTGIILWATIHHYLSQPTEPVKQTAFTAEEPRDAA